MHTPEKLEYNELAGCDAVPDDGIVYSHMIDVCAAFKRVNNGTLHISLECVCVCVCKYPQVCA